MTGLRFKDIQDKPVRFLALTSLTVEEFRITVVPFENAFQARMAKWRIDGKPRTSRRYATYKNCPLPTPEDRLLFVLVYLKLNPLQEAHGAMFGMPQSKENPWLHHLLPALREALVNLGDAPSRSLVGLAEKLDLTPEEAEKILTAYSDSPEDSSSPMPPAPTTGGPLFAMTEPRGESPVPRIKRTRSSTIAARRSATR